MTDIDSSMMLSSVNLEMTREGSGDYLNVWRHKIGVFSRYIYLTHIHSENIPDSSNKINTKIKTKIKRKEKKVK